MLPDDSEAKLNPESMDKAIATLEKFPALMKKHNVDTVIVMGTAAVRHANNKRFENRVRKALEIKYLNALSEMEETILTALAVIWAEPNADGHFWGTGGASTHFGTIVLGRIRELGDLFVGALTLLKACENNLLLVNQIILGQMADKYPWFPKKPPTPKAAKASPSHKRKALYLIGGTFRAVARLLLDRNKNVPINAAFPDAVVSFVWDESLRKQLNDVAGMKKEDFVNLAEFSYLYGLKGKGLAVEEFIGDRKKLEMSPYELRKWRESDEYKKWTNSEFYKTWKESHEYKKWEKKIWKRARLIPIMAKVLLFAANYLNPSYLKVCRPGIREGAILHATIPVLKPV